MAYTEDVNVNLNVLTGTMGGITAIMGGMSALTSSFGAMGTAAAESFGSLDGLLVSATALLTTFSVQSAEAFGQYEQGMKIVQTVSGQASYAMKELSDRANQMSISYRTSINDINDGLQTLGRAGLNSVSEQLEVLESGLQTAKLEGRNLNSVLEELIQNTAMLGGDLKSVDFGEQTEYLNTIMVGTSMTAPITSHDISQTLQYAGGTAAAAGANLENKDKLEDLMGTIAAFAQKGVKGSMSGTALRAFFTKPASQDESVVQALDQLGIAPEDLWEDGGNSMKKVSDQIGIIKGRMDALNMSTMDQVELWGKIVGPKMGQQMMKLDSSAIKELTRDIESASSAEELATQTLQTYSQKLSQMTEQGSLAYREFGEKVAMWLTPVVDLITLILGALSDPHVNFIAFATIGSLLAHGFKKAFGMISATYAQIKALLTETGMAIRNINSIASGSATGFNQSVSSVEMLNARLAQTNTELAQMQTRFLKIQPVSKTGSYVVPYGLADKNGKLPANMISTDMQKVIKGPTGVFYDQSDVKSFEKDYRKYITDQNQEQIDKAVQQHYDENTGRYRGGFGVGNKGRFIKESALREHYTNQLGLTPEQVEKETAQALKNGQAEVHSSLMSMTKKEYQQWYKGLAAAERRLSDKNNYMRNGVFNQKAYERDQLKAFNKRYQDEFIRNSPTDLFTNKVNGVRFYRGLKLDLPQEQFYGTVRALQKQAQLNDYEQARSGKINPQVTGWRDKARASTIKSLNTYDKVIKTATGSVKNFSSNLKMGITKWARGFESVIPQAEARVMKSINNIDISTTSFNEALMQLQRTSGLTATEFEQLWLKSNQLEAAFLRQYGLTLEDETVTKEDILAKQEDARATLASARVKEETMLAEAGGRLTRVAGSLTSGLSTVVGFMGGPLMAGMMALTFIMQQAAEQQQKWQEKTQEASNQLSEAKDNMGQMSEKIKEIYGNEISNLSDADVERLTDYQYASIIEAYDKNGDQAKFSDMYNNEVVKTEDLSWSKEERDNNQVKTGEQLAELEGTASTLSLKEDENIKALEDNTASLQSAAYTYSQALQKLANAGNDGGLGFKGFWSDVSDKASTKDLFGLDLDPIIESLDTIPFAGDTLSKAARSLSGIGDSTNPLSILSLKWLPPDEGFLDNSSPVLTESQADKNYAFGTDFASIFVANANRFDVEEGLSRFFGNDYNKIISLMGGINNKMTIQTRYGTISNPSQLLREYSDYFNQIPSSDAALAMAFMKDNPDEMSKLGKQMFRVEQQYDFGVGSSALSNYNAISAGYHPTGKPITASSSKTTGTALGTKDLKQLTSSISKAKLTTQDKNLKATVDKFRAMTGNKLSEQTILMMGSLQMLSDMNTVANEQIAPGVTQTVQTAAQIMDGTYSAAGYAGGAMDGASMAAANAYAIAVFLEAQAQETAVHEAYQDYLRSDDTEKSIMGFRVPSWSPIGEVMEEKDFANAISQVDSPMYNKYGRDAIETLIAARLKMQHPEYTPDQLKASAEQGLQDIEQQARDHGANYQDMLNTASGGMAKVLQDQVMAAYDQSSTGEYGKGSGSDGGSGSGSGSGSDGDKGTTTNRVDLVLCNRKTIPKLNVNLFKKPPQFTIRNKQFSIRDININTQDKPDAMVDAVKDSIIKTQQRMDPKIIQDEQAVYDPVAATDGTTPTGKTPVATK